MTNTNDRSEAELAEDHREFDQAFHLLVRIRHRQGDAAVERLVATASRFELRFCEECGQETPHDDGTCLGGHDGY